MKILPLFIAFFALFGPQTLQDFYQRGIEKSDKKDCKGAIEEFSKAIEQNPDHDLAFYNRAVEKTHLNDHRGAVKDFTRSLEITPTSSAYYGRAKSQGLLENYEEAITDFTRAIELEPGDISSYFDRGIIKLRIGDSSGREDLRKARDLGKIQMVQQLDLN